MIGELIEPIEVDDWFEPEATQLRQALADPMLRHFPADAFKTLRNGMELVAEACRLDDPTGLIRADELLEHGWEEADGVIGSLGLAGRVFGRWGAHFFAVCVEKLPESYFDPDGYSPELLAELLTDSSSAVGDVPDSYIANQPKLFIPNPFQQAILSALDRRALTKQALANEVCKGEGTVLYRPSGLPELRSLGLVAHKRRVGFYRPDAPPPNAICMG